MRYYFFLLLLFYTFSAEALQYQLHFPVRRPVHIVDIDDTLLDTKHRSLAAFHEIGRLYGVPQLVALIIELVDPECPQTCRNAGLTDKHLIHQICGESYTRSALSSHWGRRFIINPHYMRFDKLIEGAPEFWETQMLELEANLVYLSARREEEVEEETRHKVKEGTILQLQSHSFPGYGAREYLRDRTQLILKPNDFQGSNTDFKEEVTLDIAKQAPILSGTDDCKKNCKMYHRVLHPSSVIIRPTSNVLFTEELPASVEHITTYRFNRKMHPSGKVEIEPNIEQLAVLSKRMKACRDLLWIRR